MKPIATLLSCSLVAALTAVVVPIAIGGVASQHFGRMVRTDIFIVRLLVERPQVLVIGDSRVEQALSPSSGVMHVGYGAARLGALVNITSVLCRLGRPRRVVFAAGLNDGRERLTSRADFARDATRLATACPRAERVIVAIWPGDPSQGPYGAGVAAALIMAFNADLARIADATGAKFVPAPTSGAGTTTDGLHFTPAANDRWSQLINDARESLLL